VEGRRRTGGGCYGGLEYEELGSRVQEEGEGGLAQEWRDRAEQELQEKAEWRTRDIQALRSAVYHLSPAILILYSTRKKVK
jgi:hypothetical protein